MTKTQKIIGWTSAVILLPILYGIYYYHQLPTTMAIHFNFQNQADGWAGRNLVVFGIPLMMLVLQWFAVILTRLNATHKGTSPRLERILYGIVPTLNLILYVITIQFNLGNAVDIRRIVMLVIGLVFIAVGNYLPTAPVNSKIGFHARAKLEEQDWLRVTRRLAYILVVGGLLCIGSVFLAPLASLIAIGFVIIGVIVVRLVSLR
ncbi:DUF1648 domain-containing protein [Secundilactobacillus paracollinoides]|uniref:DUF1648 domain-containing protein n=1 Tax=Secundilactobacillus paracollinoides TaxID=240427 RepID=UPI0006F01E94|nr:DUF1648 domain-containing protein [Secundilactobacillus paracollinoides]KRL76967.1 hypothetical protein FC17_GL001421 [Secundilactobacillus paracollinoides DSM 15502 = JCM 11969]